MNIIEAAKKYKKIRRKSWWNIGHICPSNPSSGWNYSLEIESLTADDWEEYVEPGKLSAVEQIQAEAKYRQARETGDFFGTYIDINKPVSAWKKFSEKPQTTKIHTMILVRKLKGNYPNEVATASWWDSGRLTLNQHVLDQSQYEWCYIPE